MLMMEWKIVITDCETLLQKKTFHWNGRKIMHLSEVFLELLYHRISCKELLILTEKQETLDLANRMHIPVVGLETEDSFHLTGTPYILQGIDAESVRFLERVYQRYYDLPVVIIETEHLFIREIKKSDTEDLFRLYHCKDVQKEVDQAKLNREELIVFIESYCRVRYPFYDYGMWVIEEKQTGCFVGEAGIEEDTHFIWKEKGICLEAGYAILPEFRKRGYAVEALTGILSYVKEKRKQYLWKRLSCYIRPENAASIRTAERCGLRKEEKRRYGEQKEFEQYSLKL